MKQSQLFGKTSRNVPKEETSTNAQLLIKAGYVDKLMAGVYTYLPLGQAVLKKLNEIIRQEMNAIDSQEILMPALHPKENWVATGRWDTVDILFKTKSQTGTDYGLGASHEEVVIPLTKKFIQSYRDLPYSVYQIQTKFRDELRSKSGLLRGREFVMKDMYSFHTSQEDLTAYYNKVIQAYKNVFERIGLTVLITEASGGIFTQNTSHEFQVVTNAGEDETLYCSKCLWAQNKEISKHKVGDKCPNCHESELKAETSVEAANIFDLGTKYSKDFNVTFKDKDGSEKMVLSGCYGIGVSRLIGTMVEALHDEKGIIWPKSVTPFHLHLVALGNDEEINKGAQEIYNKLKSAGISVLFDDRDAPTGEKLNDADLIGISLRGVFSKKSAGKIEIKERKAKEAKLMTLDETVKFIKDYYA